MGVDIAPTWCNQKSVGVDRLSGFGGHFANFNNDTVSDRNIAGTFCVS